MTEPTPDLPDWIEDKISYNDDYETQDHFFIEPLVETNRPWLSRSTIEEEAGVSDETARTRLKRLEEKEIVNSAPGGDGTVYWIHDERSDWPIPPDIDLPDPEEMAVVVDERHRQHDDAEGDIVSFTDEYREV